MLISVLRFAFFLFVVKPLVLIVIGLNVRRLHLLPSQGPAIIVANHNSHLDTLVLISLFPLKLLRQIQPVAAADYFLENRWLAWFALNIIGILPISRKVSGKSDDPLAECVQALARGKILIFFPEGSRGEPEEMAKFKSGIAHLAARLPDIPVTPVYLHGLGKALPKGDFVLVPFFCDVFVDPPLKWTGNRKTFMQDLQSRFKNLGEEDFRPEWE